MSSKAIATNKNNIHIKILLDKIKQTKKRIKKAEAPAQPPAQPVQQVVQPPAPSFYRVLPFRNYGNRPYEQADQAVGDVQPTGLATNYQTYDAQRQALVQQYLDQAQAVSNLPEDTSSAISLPSTDTSSYVDIPPVYPEPTAPPEQPTAVPEEPAPPAPPPAVPQPFTPPVGEIQPIPEEFTQLLTEPWLPQRGQGVPDVAPTAGIVPPPQFERPQLPAEPNIRDPAYIDYLTYIGFQPVSLDVRGRERFRITNPATGKQVFTDTPMGKAVIQQRRVDILTGVYQLTP